MKALNDKDYLRIADDLIRDQYPEAAIKEYDSKLSAMNPRLKDGVLGAIRRRITEAYAQLNAELNSIAGGLNNGRKREHYPATDELKESLELPRMQDVLKLAEDYFKTPKDELADQKKATEKPEPVTIPEEHLNIIRDELTKMNLLTDKGENKGLKPMVAALLPEMANKYYTTQQEILKQIATRWNLTSDQTKDFKVSKKRRHENATKAGLIMSKIPS